MSIVTQSPHVSTQSMVFISGRSKGTWHGDLYRQMGGGGDGGKKRGREKDVGRITGGCVGMFTNQHDEE